VGKLIGLDRLKKEMFMPVVQVRDITRARIATVEEKKKLGLQDRDVLVDSAMHGRRIISRRELVSNFRELDGRIIKLRGWKSGKNYNILGNSGLKAFAMRIPTGYVLSYRGKKISGGKDYVVCRADSAGGPLITESQVVKRERFRRMFTVPMTDHLRDSMNGKVVKRESKVEVPSIVKDVQVNIPQYPENKVVETDKVIETNKYNIIGQVVDIENRALGYVVRDPKGKVMDLTEANVMLLATRRLLGNATFVVDEHTGKQWLRGVGIQLKELPKKRINS